LRGRTALTSTRHLAKVVAIKRMQGAGKSLAEIQRLWPQLDDASLARMTGIAVEPPTRRAFWRDGLNSLNKAPEVERVETVPLELAPGAVLTFAVPDGIAISSADLRALRAAAAPLVAELARRGLTLEDKP